jgi:ABC-type transport system substrate-binding protein
VGIKARVEIMEQAQYMSKLTAKNLKGIFMQMLWYGPSRSASGDAMTHFLPGNPYCYNSTPEIEKEILRGNTARTDREMIEAGKRLSKVIRESCIKTFLWANYFPYALGPRIEYWEPELAALPPSSYELIRLKKQYQ